MASFFRGESVNVYFEADFRTLSPLKKTAILLAFILWIPFALLLFLPELFSVGLAGLIACGFIFLPFVCIYVAELHGKQRTAPYIFIVIGLLGELGYFLVSLYLRKYGFTLELLTLIVCIPVFIGFFFPGIAAIVIGRKRNKKWNTYSRSVTGAVVNSTLQYEINGCIYRQALDPYFDEYELPPEGEQMELHVDPKNPNAFLMSVQKGGFLIAFGISFLVVSVLALAIMAIFLMIL